MLDLPYRVLGALAAVSYRLSLFRVNGIPSNWLIIVFLGIFSAITVGWAVESHRNRGGATQATIADIVNGTIDTGTYVSVSGELDLDGIVGEAGTEEDEDAPAWVPIADAQSPRAIYLKITPSEVQEGDSGFGSYRGTVRQVPGELRKFIANENPLVDGKPVDARRMIVMTDRPGNVAALASVAGALATPALLMILVFAMRYVVFRPTGVRGPVISTGATSASPTTAPELRVTGTFSLNEKDRQRFHIVPSLMADLESGDRAFLSNIDASNRFMGTKTDNREGTWGIMVKAGTLEPPQCGVLYWGLKARPALRLRFTDAITNRPAWAIATTATEAQREDLLAALLRPIEPVKPDETNEPVSEEPADSDQPQPADATASTSPTAPVFGIGADESDKGRS